MSSAIVWVATVCTRPTTSATIAPTERSMPPPMITNVMPMLTTPIAAASRRIVSALSVDGEPVARRDRADDADQQQRDDEPEVAADAGAQQGERPALGSAVRLERGLLDARRCPGSCRNLSFHDEVEDRGLVDRRWRRTRGRPRPRGRRGPGRRDRAPPRSRWRRPRRRRRGRPATGSAGRSRCGRRRRRRGWARRAAAPGSRAAASGRARPSAGCRRTGCGPRGSTPAGRTSRLAVSSAARRRSAPRSRKPSAGEAASSRRP